MTPREIDCRLLLADYELRQESCDREKVQTELEAIRHEINKPAMSYHRREKWVDRLFEKCSLGVGQDPAPPSPAADS